MPRTHSGCQERPLPIFGFFCFPEAASTVSRSRISVRFDFGRKSITFRKIQGFPLLGRLELQNLDILRFPDIYVFKILKKYFFCKKNKNFLCRIFMNVLENTESGTVFRWLFTKPAVQRFDFGRKSVTFRKIQGFPLLGFLK